MTSALTRFRFFITAQTRSRSQFSDRAISSEARLGPMWNEWKGHTLHPAGIAPIGEMLAKVDGLILLHHPRDTRTFRTAFEVLEFLHE